MSKLCFDHIAVFASSLTEGVTYVERILGVSIPFGGNHLQMGTHNHLLRLGDGLFLEIIAVDPNVEEPERARWFSLDSFGDQKPRIGTWVVRSNDIKAAKESAPIGIGEILKVSRGQLTWQITVPEDGGMLFEGAYPTIIEWPQGSLPADKMVDHNCRLQKLNIEHPQALKISQSLGSQLTDSRIEFVQAKLFKISATIKTPSGMKTLE